MFTINVHYKEEQAECGYLNMLLADGVHIGRTHIILVHLLTVGRERLGAKYVNGANLLNLAVFRSYLYSDV